MKRVSRQELKRNRFTKRKGLSCTLLPRSGEGGSELLPATSFIGAVLNAGLVQLDVCCRCESINVRTCIWSRAWVSCLNALRSGIQGLKENVEYVGGVFNLSGIVLRGSLVYGLAYGRMKRAIW